MRFLPKFIPLIISGKKTCTTRLEPKANIGDVIDLGDVVIKIMSIKPWPLYVAFTLYGSEGFDTMEDFKKEIFAIYPSLKDDTLVYVHRFKVVSVKGVKQ